MKVEKYRGITILGSGAVGLVLARALIESPSAGVVALAFGAAIAVSIFIRKIEQLIYAWFILTTFIWAIIYRFLPIEYYNYSGRGLFWGLLACIFVAWAVENLLKGRRFLRFNNLSLKATAVMFLLWGVLSLSSSIDITTSIKKLISIAIGLMTTYMFYDFLSRDRRSLEKMLTMLFWVVLGIALSSVIAAMYAVVKGVPIYKQIGLWMWNSNSLGYFLFVTSVPLIDSYIRPLQNRRIKFLWVGLVVLGLLISSSRSAWLAASVSYAYILWSGRIRVAIAVGIIGTLIFIGLGFPIFGEDAASFVFGQQYTGRREIWTAAWKTAWDYPLLGTGLGTSWETISRYINTPYLVGQDTHNAYLKNAVEMGFMSVVFQLSFYAAFIFSAVKIEKGLTDSALKGVARGATATIIGLIVHGVFENGFILTAFGAAEFTVMWPYIVIAIPFVVERLAAQEKKEQRVYVS